MKTTYILLFILFSQQLFADSFNCEQAPDGIIWCDDFEDSLSMSEKYFEYGDNDGDFIVMDSIGRGGSKGIRVIWQQGEVGAGGMKKSFGRTPSNYIGKHAAMPDSSFNEIYWRMDVKHQEGWQGGGPAKLSRALCMANADWATGMMAHIWSGGPGGVYLGMDPASGISEKGVLRSTRYNDFDNLRWLGFKPGNIDMFSTENSGRWFCIEAHVRLNTPGESDGIFEFWINDTLQAGTYNLNWHGDYNSNPDNMKINAVFFENYWNGGSPVEQERYFDNIVISTKRIGCDCGESTGVEDENKSGVLLVPNPAREYIEIINPTPNPSPKERGVRIEIFDVLGRIDTPPSPLFLEGGIVRLDVSHLQPGIYFVRVGDEFLKFVKM